MILTTLYRKKEKQEIIKKWGKEMIERGFSLKDIEETAQAMIDEIENNLLNKEGIDLLHLFD